MKKIVMVLLIILILGGIIIGSIMMKAAKSMGMGNVPVEDYDRRISIWNRAAGMNSRSKLQDMNIDYKKSLFSSTMAFAKAIVGEDYLDVERIVDTFTYNYEIKRGYEVETYEDQPYIIPYLAKESDCAVLILPGGGYGYKSMDGSTGEGKDVALTLQSNGINAFVLHYRTNPYTYPIPQLDAQRAVRWLRYHGADYGIDPKKISMIGFSAGGTEIGTFINLVQGQNMFPEDYTMDEVDKVDDHIDLAAMIYPCLTWEYNKSMLYCMFDADEVRNEDRRNNMLEMLDLSKQIKSQDVKQFISYGTADAMVDPRGTVSYIEAAQDTGVDVTVVVADNQPHGFAQKHYMELYLKWLKSEWK